MSALRKAGVWLGLVEEEDDDRSYDDGYETKGRYRDSGYRDRDRDSRDGWESRTSRYAEEFADEDEELDEQPPPRTRSRLGERVPLERSSSRGELSRESSGRGDLERADGERASVRSITRPSAPEPVAYPTRENLALAPQVQLRERAVVADEDQRYQITTLHPTTYREARTIGEHFRDGVPVIINLTEMDEADARRLVDFAAGLAFGLRGTIERVTNRVFLLSPANVQVTAEDKAKIAEGGFFNLS
ncbi:cell division protein SepF [Phytohabitans suffuscus]|uniref:Cell division protein SepF n=1 Tax=Phytohabitans suffuscus TaxID=624315 RepID=A0A6F8YQP6_9ACTN|nr:cell division protein SepF [Phytohabitans suffuscus]BCB88376.1 cell division protein SepF 2 [Phytohabitans suffuscus]